MNTELTTNCAALANLALTPDEVIAKKREELEQRLAELRKQQEKWFDRLLARRRRTLLAGNCRGHSGWEGNRPKWFPPKGTMATCKTCCVDTHDALIANFVIRLFQVMSLIPLFLHMKMAVTLVPFGILALLCVFFKCVSTWRHLLGYLIFPALPIIHIIDLYAVKMTDVLEDARREDEIRSLVENLARLEEPSWTPVLYKGRFETVRAELLGSTSQICRTESDLRKRLSDRRVFIERLRARKTGAVGNDEREQTLQAAIARSEQREARLAHALETTQRTIARVRGFIDECEQSVQNPLEDEQLIREAEAGEDADEEAIARAHDVTASHIELVRTRLVRIASTVTHVRVLPLADQTEDLEAYFNDIEDMAKRVDALG